MPRTGTSPEVAARRDAIYAVLEASEFVLSVRNVFYTLVGKGIVPKEERVYRRVSDDIVAMRKSGRVPWEWVADASRGNIGETSRVNASADATIVGTLSRLRPVSSVWGPLRMRPQLWVESRSVAGMIEDIPLKYEVSLWPTAGNMSWSFLHEGASRRPTHIGILVDADKYGRRIATNIREDLTFFADKFRNPGTEYDLIALTEDQAVAWGLPEQVGKPGYQLEALPAGDLRRLVEDWILGLLPPGRWDDYEDEVDDLQNELDETAEAIKVWLDERNEDDE